MKLHRRRSGSQRPMKVVTIDPIYSHDGPELVFLADGIYYTIIPETKADWRQLFSNLQLAYRVWSDKNEIK